MALTKKMLQAMDISDEKIEQIIEAHRDSINGLTSERDDLKVKLEDANKEVDRLKGVEQELTTAQAKATEAEETKTKLQELQEEYDNFKADVDAKATLSAKEKAYRALLVKSGIPEKRFDAIMKVTKLDDLEIGEDGTFADEATVLANIDSEWSDFKVTETKKGADTATPPAGGSKGAFEQMSLAEKMAYANENPDNAEVKAWLK